MSQLIKWTDDGFYGLQPLYPQLIGQHMFQFHFQWHLILITRWFEEPPKITHHPVLLRPIETRSAGGCGQGISSHSCFHIAQGLSLCISCGFISGSAPRCQSDGLWTLHFRGNWSDPSRLCRRLKCSHHIIILKVFASLCATSPPRLNVSRGMNNLVRQPR